MKISKKLESNLHLVSVTLSPLPPITEHRYLLILHLPGPQYYLKCVVRNHESSLRSWWLFIMKQTVMIFAMRRVGSIAFKSFVTRCCAVTRTPHLRTRVPWAVSLHGCRELSTSRAVLLFKAMAWPGQNIYPWGLGWEARGMADGFTVLKWQASLSKWGNTVCQKMIHFLKPNKGM